MTDQQPERCIVNNGTSGDYIETYDDGTKLWIVKRENAYGGVDRGVVYERPNGRTTAVCRDAGGTLGRAVYGSGPAVDYFADAEAGVAALARLFEELDAERCGSGWRVVRPYGGFDE